VNAAVDLNQIGFIGSYVDLWKTDPVGAGVALAVDAAAAGGVYYLYKDVKQDNPEQPAAPAITVENTGGTVNINAGDGGTITENTDNSETRK
jgi:hypothetical protein